MAGLMIATELAQRRLVQLKQNLAQLLGFRIAGCETLTVNLTQRTDEGVPVFAADFAILVTVAIVETGLLMLLSLVPQPTASSRRDQMTTERGLIPMRSPPRHHAI